MGGGALHGGFLRDPSLYLHEFQSKPNGKIRTARSTSSTGIEPATSCLPALSTELLHHWWGDGKGVSISIALKLQKELPSDSEFENVENSGTEECVAFICCLYIYIFFFISKITCF